MAFLSPLWLALLLPWTAVAVWLLRTRRDQRMDVPFLALWRTPVGAESSPARDAVRVPPMAVMAAMVGALLAIVAAARPAVSASLPTGGPHITIILDRGLTMSVGDRRREVVEAAKGAVLETFGLGPTTFVPVPDSTPEETDRSDWLGPAMALPPTQERTRDAVQFAVRRALARDDGQGGAVVVLTDQPIETDDARVLVITPAEELSNVGITRFVVRENASRGGQAMVTVANQSGRRHALLRVRSGAGNRGKQGVVERHIELTSGGGEANFFVNLPQLDATAVAEIEPDVDDILMDNVVHARRQFPYPAIEVRAAVPAEVSRVAAAYAKTRPPVETSPRVAVVTDDRVPEDAAAAIVSSSTVSHGVGAVQVVAHPVCAAVDWSSAKARAVGEPTGGGESGGWRAVLSIDGHPAVAVRETPHRQVWIGLDAPEFSRTADFVVFWTNVFDWLAARDGVNGDGQVWASTVVPPIEMPAPPTNDWRAKLASLRARETRATDLAPVASVACVICLIVAAVVWPAGRSGGGLTAFSTPRTV